MHKGKFNPLQEYYGTSKLFAIYPDHWRKDWGAPPCLGTVRADNKYFAKYAAYDKKLLPLNATFKPRPVEVKRKPYDPNNSVRAVHIRT